MLLLEGQATAGDTVGQMGPHGVVLPVQLVNLPDSRLSGHCSKIHHAEYEYDPDWEIDPKEIKLMDKLGGCPLPSRQPNLMHLALSTALRD